MHVNWMRMCCWSAEFLRIKSKKTFPCVCYCEFAIWLWNRGRCSQPSTSDPPRFLSLPLCVAPGCSPQCDGSWNSGKRSAGISGRHTGPSGARNMRTGAYKATGRGPHLSKIIPCLCLPRLWQVDWLRLWERPSVFHQWPLIWLGQCTNPYSTQLPQTFLLNEVNCWLNVRKYHSTEFCLLVYLEWPSFIYFYTTKIKLEIRQYLRQLLYVRCWITFSNYG